MLSFDKQNIIAFVVKMFKFVMKGTLNKIKLFK